jgi:hypothetical protein
MMRPSTLRRSLESAVGRPLGRGGSAEHRLPGAPGRPRPPRPRAAPGRGPPAGGRGPGGLAVATQQANRAHDRERELRQHQQHRDGWLEAKAHLGPQYRQVVRTLAWQRRATGLAVEVDRPGYVLEALGPVPASTRGRRAWRHAAAEIEQYRHTYHVTDPDRALGPEPHDPAQRANRQRVHTARPGRGQAARRRPHPRCPTTSEGPNQRRPREQRGRSGPERAAG